MSSVFNLYSSPPVIKIERDLPVIELEPTQNDQLETRVSHKPKAKFSQEKILEFITYLEREDVLWNPKHPAYKDNIEIHTAYKRIAASFKNAFSINALKDEKAILFKNFRSMHRRVQLKKGLKPNWFAYEALSKFLDDEHTSSKELNTNQNSADVEISPVPVKRTAHQPVQTGFSRPHNKKTIRGPSVKDIGEKIDFAFNVLQRIQKKPPPDELTLYGELLVTKLRTLDKKTRDLAMFEIDNLLFRLKHQNSGQTSAISG